MSQILEFMGNHIILCMSFVTVLFAYIYTLYNDRNATFTRINTDQLTRLVNKENAKLIDVRSADVYKAGHIVNAINIPLQDIINNKAQLSTLKKRPVITYCDRGISSQTACKKLTEQGVDQVFNLTGGIQAWIADKLPLAK